VSNDDLPDLPAFLKIPQAERDASWKGRKLTHPGAFKAPADQPADPSTAAFLAEIARRDREQARKKKADRKEARIITARQRASFKAALEAAKTGDDDMAKKIAKKAAKKTARKSAPKAAKKTARATKSEGGVRPGSKLETIVGLLKRPEGCTTKQVLQATDWPSVSMPQQAKAAGLTLKKEKVDGVTVYRAA
jgi:hypothetical protein